MKKAQHTPGPWIVVDGEEKTPWINSKHKGDQEIEPICNLYEDCTPWDAVGVGNWDKPFKNASANAQFIVTACNAHEDLLLAARLGLDALDLLEIDYRKSGDLSNAARISGKISIVSEAITKAKGK